MFLLFSKPTFSVGHAVKEDPVLSVWSVFDEGHVVARLDAEDGEQLQFVSGRSVSEHVRQEIFGDVQGHRLMGPSLRMRVNLRRTSELWSLNTPTNSTWTHKQGFQTHHHISKHKPSGFNNSIRPAFSYQHNMCNEWSQHITTQTLSEHVWQNTLNPH